jgi:hypothetical protein
MIRSVIYLTVILISMAVGLCQFRRSDYVFKVLTLLLLFTFLSETTSFAFAHLVGNNSLIHKIYAPLLVIFFCLIYYELFIARRVKILSICVSLVVFSFVLFVDIFQEKAVSPAYAIMVIALELIFFSILYFYQMISNPSIKDIGRSPEFWLNTGVLIYFTGSFIFWATFDYFYHHGIIISQYMIVLWVLNIIYYSTLGISLYFHGKTKKNDQ